jgi:nucleoside-diphosphate-sugar epimerase
MKVLVTGATGFIGGYVIKELLDKGHEVIASSTGAGNLKEYDWAAKVVFVPLNFSELVDHHDYFMTFHQPDVMIHLAWEGLPNYTSAFHEIVNLPRHELLLHNIIKNGLRSLTVAGTCLEYGMQEGVLSEDMPAMPSNPYARAKDALRKRLEQWRCDLDFSLKWTRLFYTYGKGQNPKSLLSQLDTAVSKGEKIFRMSAGQQVRDFLPVETVAEYLVKIALQKEVEGVVNCCSGIPVTVEEFVKNYLRQKNISIELKLGYYPYPEYEPMNFWGDTKKLNKIINHE